MFITNEIYLTIIFSLLLFIGVVLAFTFLIYIKFQDERNHNLYLQGSLNPYRRKKYFLTFSEKALYKILEEYVKDKNILIFPQLHLSSFLEINEDNNDLLGKFNWINKLSVDFALFDKQSIQPLLIIELNDPTHFWNSRKTRDEFVSNALKANDIQLLTFKNDDIIRKDLLFSQLDEKLKNNKGRIT